MSGIRKKPGKDIRLELSDAGAHIKEISLSTWEVQGDTFTLKVYGRTSTGRWVWVEAKVDRDQVRNLASGLWNVIFADEAKTAAKRRAMQENK